MPEGVEVEMYRQLAEKAVGAEVASIDADDSWFLKGETTPDELQAALLGEQITGTRRIGKLMLLDFSSGHRLGVRFGMTGRLLVGDQAAIEHLEYSSKRNDPAWDRFGLGFVDGRDLVVRDPRRLGGVELDPDEGRLGHDVFSVTLGQLRSDVLVGSVAIKARLLDQHRLAGVGNLIADETLWRAGLDPARPAGALSDDESRRLQRRLRSVVKQFLANGGSHTGRLQSERHRDGRCPDDGAELDRRTIGGRTTYSCPMHQR